MQWMEKNYEMPFSVTWFPDAVLWSVIFSNLKQWQGNSREKERILFVLVDLKQLLGVASCKRSAHLNSLMVMLFQLLDRFFQIALWISPSEKLSQSSAPIRKRVEISERTSLKQLRFNIFGKLSPGSYNDPTKQI